jgi:hypothetical protein
MHHAVLVSKTTNHPSLYAHCITEGSQKGTLGKWSMISFPYQKPERRGGESGDWGPGSTLVHCDGRVRWVLMAAGKVSEDFFLCPYRKIPGFPAPIHEIPWEFPPLSLSQTGRDFPYADEKVPYGAWEKVPYRTRGLSGLRTEKLQWHLQKKECFSLAHTF